MCSSTYGDAAKRKRDLGLYIYNFHKNSHALLPTRYKWKINRPFEVVSLYSFARSRAYKYTSRVCSTEKITGVLGTYNIGRLKDSLPDNQSGGSYYVLRPDIHLAYCNYLVPVLNNSWVIQYEYDLPSPLQNLWICASSCCCSEVALRLWHVASCSHVESLHWVCSVPSPSPIPTLPPWTSLNSSQVRPTLGKTKILQMRSAAGNEISDTFANQMLLA